MAMTTLNVWPLEAKQPRDSVLFSLSISSCRSLMSASLSDSRCAILAALACCTRRSPEAPAQSVAQAATVGAAEDRFVLLYSSVPVEAPVLILELHTSSNVWLSI